MPDLARRFPNNPIIGPADVPPTRPGLSVIGVMNPGAFCWSGRSWLLFRVAEGVPADGESVSAPIRDASVPDGLRVMRVGKHEPGLVNLDSRGFAWRGENYLTTISHLRLASSEDGIQFAIEPTPALVGDGDLERFGIEDARVTGIDGRFHIVYTAVSPDGFGVGMASTADWRSYARLGMGFAPPNKDCVLFPERVDGRYMALHRPVSQGLGGQFMWLASSPDLVHWGEHRCVLRARSGAWDSAKVGAGPPPVRVPQGWLELYHGVDDHQRYCMGAVLLDARDPGCVLGRSRDPIMEPLADYERRGFFGNVVFGTGAIVRGEELTLYYGAADEWVCGATFSIPEILASLS